MSKTKEFYHEQITEGMQSKTAYEPYIFKYIAYFKLNGETITLYGDSHEHIEELAKRIVPGFSHIEPSFEGDEFEYDMVCEYWTIPVLIFETGISHY